MREETPLLSELFQEVSIALGLAGTRIIFNRAVIDGVIIEGEIMALTLKDNQKVPISVMGVSAKGNPTPLDGPVTFASNDPNLTINVIDGNNAEIAAVGPVGNFQVTASGDAKIGPGEDIKFGILDVEVVASEAVNILINPGTPVDQ